MGEHEIAKAADADAQRIFVRALLEDVQALERIIAEGRIESGIRRIGAEQEMFLVDSAMRPLCASEAVLERLEGGAFTTELAQYNLEANLSPRVMGGDCLSQMESEVDDYLLQVRGAALEVGARPLLVGILPTLGRENLSLDEMTPHPRYFELNRGMSELCEGEFHTLIKGVDELKLLHDNVMLEACNTSFQIHFQVGHEEFSSLYNVAQAVTAPVLAAAVNSPLLLSHRLWHETRVALFQQSLDTRSRAEKDRSGAQRVTFGEHWVKDGALEIFREDIARFRSLIRGREEESPLELLDRGEMPQLLALCLHNGTVYRWNRPCYGVKDNVAHLRIENRVLPAGPTVLDEMANAAFFFGLMSSVSHEYGDVSSCMAFEDAKDNFTAAARYGLQARFNWIRGRGVAADRLILDELLPLARQGLASRGIDSSDVDRYMGVMEERVRSGRTGAQWAFDSLAGMGDRGTVNGRMRAVAAGMHEQQWSGKPVHEWPLAEHDSQQDWREDYRKVSQVMTTDLFTVHPEDLIDLAASVMDWKHLRHVPVESTEGELVGILSHRAVLRLVAQGKTSSDRGTLAVRDLMQPDPITVTPDTSSLEAISTMRTRGVSCLPVVRDKKLVGIVTEHDFINVAARLLEEKLRED
jgi:CBS domain-containing protein